jgi:MFS family permease
MNIPTAGPYAALKIPDFRNFILARLCVTLAIQIQATVVGWQVYNITSEPFSLGLIGLAEAIPAIGVSLYAGHVADIVDRKKIIIAAVSILLVSASVLLFFTLEPGGFLLKFGVIPIYAVIFCTGFARGFLSPANFSFMPQLVPRNLYTNAVSLNSTFWEAASIGGPLLAGLLYGFIGISASYLADALLVAAGLAFYFSIPNRPVPPSSAEQGVIEKISAGLRFVFKNQIVLSAISLDLFAVLFGGAVALLPVFAKEILHVGPEGLGLLRAASSIGAVSTAVLITHYPLKKHMGNILLLCVGGYGLCMIAFGLSTNFWLSVSVLMISGAFDAVSVIVRGTLIQTLTPENMKGRVSAVNSMFVGSSNEIGAFESGTAARFMGVVSSVVFGGCMTLIVVGITGWRAKKLRQLDTIH